MLTLFLLLVIPLGWPLIAKALFKLEITWAEMFLNIVIGVAIVLVGWYAGKYGMMTDTEIINGQVLGKYSKEVPCEHSYRCNCHTTCTGSGANRSCSESCSTCYEHNHDVDWKLKTSVGEIEIHRVNRKGDIEPPRFTRAAPGDPVAKSQLYLNYIKAAPDSLFNHLEMSDAMKDYAGKVPAYPSNVYDYHYVDRVIAQGLPQVDLAQWNLDLANMLRELGPAKQVNTVFVLTAEKSPRYADAIAGSWLGGKKNDVVVVIGSPQFPQIAWVRVLSWTPNELFKVQLRDALLDLKTIDRTQVLSVWSQMVAKSYQRRNMQDFAYLEDAIEPPPWAIAVLAFLGLGVSVGLSIYLKRVDLLGGAFTSSTRRYTYRRF